jgi:hypothetical protein
MLGTLSPREDRDVEVLIREARRRQRRRWAGVLIGGLLVAGAGWFALGTRSGRAPDTPSGAGSGPPAKVGPQLISPPLIPRRVDTSLLLWGPDASFVDNLTSRRVSSHLPVLRDMGYGDYQPLAAVVGDKVVFVGRGLSVVGHHLTGQPRRLARTPSFAPAADPSHVWLVSTHGATQSVRLTNVATGRSGAPIHLPRNTTLIRGTNAGLLLDNLRRGEAVELWNPGSSPVPLPDTAKWSDGFDATNRLVAYGTGCTDLSPHSAYEPDACTTLRVYNVMTGHLASYPTPHETLGWVPFEFNLVDAISPTGSYVAAEAATLPRQVDEGRLYIVSLTHPRTPPIAVPSSKGSVRVRVAWSARGDWLFYQGPRQRLWAYQVGTQLHRSSNTPCCQYTVMAAVPNNG